mmetsp:Transcript_6753/g.20057  ORF Transcript_6753/g.20057 Transcript_6753/m.20057 type:complete len:924 (-) Transcript_6753:1392-4163(-)
MKGFPRGTAVAATVTLGACLAAGVHGYASAFLPDSTTDQPFICDYRKFAWEFAKAVQPTHDVTLTFDALLLGTLCNETRPAAPPPPPAPSQQDCAFYVATDGSDSNHGTTPTSAFLSPSKGVAAGRGSASGKTVCFGPGVFYLTETVELTAADSGITLQGSAAGQTWFSGAKVLPSDLKWTTVKHVPAKPAVLVTSNDTNNQGGCTKDDPAPIASGGCGCYNDTRTAEECAAKCTALGPKGCPSFAWSGGTGAEGTTAGGWPFQCCIHADGVWRPQTGNPDDRDHVVGKWTAPQLEMNIVKAELPADAASWLPEGPHLRVGGGRSTRARHPNANPETDQWPVGWIPDAQTWLPAKSKPEPQFVQVMNELINSRNDGLPQSQGKNYSGGIGGPCDVFDPPFSYWCSAHPAGGGGFQYYVPSGMTLPTGAFPDGAGPGNWAKGGSGATVHAFRRSHWASWMFDVASVDPDTIKFGAGGYQGCRGGPGQDWFVENVQELLDSAGEHYVDTTASPPVLYYALNGSATAPDGDVAVPLLKILLRANTSQESPVKGLTLLNIGFRDAAPTYMDPHGVPSGGDWALERLGAVYIEGSTGLTIDHCTFERNDGNALMLSGYNRAAKITNSHFTWTGGSAIAAWGKTDELSDGGIHGWDATKGDIPQGTLIEGNIMRETGIWEKQSSCFFQAKTAATTLVRNLCFNLPRAGFNFNDGAGGGDEVHENLIFNSCRETSDHGPINSWDRQPYVTTFGIEGPGKATAHMVPRNISYNFLVANYGGGNGAVDNDDESLRYENNHNFQVYGHQKFKTGAIRSYGNVIAYASEFGGKWSTPGTIADEPNVMFDNTVFFVNGAHYHSTTGGWVGKRAYNNKLVGENITTADGKTLEQWQAADPANNDVGSTYTNTPIATQATQILAAARTLLAPVLQRK